MSFFATLADLAFISRRDPPMNFRDAAEIVNASVSTIDPHYPNGLAGQPLKPLPRRRTPRMILADIRATHAALVGLIAELEERLPHE